MTSEHLRVYLSLVDGFIQRLMKCPGNDAGKFLTFNVCYVKLLWIRMFVSD